MTYNHYYLFDLSKLPPLLRPLLFYKISITRVKSLFHIDSFVDPYPQFGSSLKVPSRYFSFPRLVLIRVVQLLIGHVVTPVSLYPIILLFVIRPLPPPITSWNTR